jgi:S-adenosylmethionine:tRNA ribosyltransferase-isomerase
MKSSRIKDHDMHAEAFTVTAELIHTLTDMDYKATCVGTTSLRTLESLYWLGVKIIQSGGMANLSPQIKQWEAYNLPQKYPMKESFQAIRDWMDKQQIKEFVASTRLMIVPGYKFQVADTLITNFHQPRSTLLLLIAAFIGESWKEVYHFALQNGFRFLSYGDSSLLFR